MRWGTTLASLCLVLLVSGCVDDSPDASAAVPTYEITSVAGASRTGFCASSMPFGEKVCHSIRLRFTNRDDETVDVGQFRWRGITTEGGAYSADRIEGPEEAAPGGNPLLVVHFQLDDDRPRIGKVRWEKFGFSGDHAEAAVPSY